MWKYGLASFNDKKGFLTKSFIKENDELIHVNELIQRSIDNNISQVITEKAENIVREKGPAFEIAHSQWLGIHDAINKAHNSINVKEEALKQLERTLSLYKNCLVEKNKADNILKEKQKSLQDAQNYLTKQKNILNELKDKYAIDKKKKQNQENPNNSEEKTSDEKSEQFKQEKHVQIVEETKSVSDEAKDAQTNAFLGNLKAINEADVIVAITDGKDMGTIWESGYAFARKKPIIYYAETLGNNQFNLMLAKSGVAVCRNQTELKIALRREETYEVKDTYDAYQGEIE